MALEQALRELLNASSEAEQARLEALQAWAHFWVQQPDEDEVRAAWAALAGQEQAHLLVRMSRDEARHVLELMRRWDEPGHNAQEHESLIRQLRELGLQRPSNSPTSP